MNRLLVSSGATGVLFSTNHPLFVRRGARSSQGEGTCPALKRKAPREVLKRMYRFCWLPQPPSADNPPSPTQIVDLANKVDGVHPGYRAFHAKGVVVGRDLQSLFRSCAAQSCNAIQRQPDSGDPRASLMAVGCRPCPTARLRWPRGIAIKYHPGRRR